MFQMLLLIACTWGDSTPMDSDDPGDSSSGVDDTQDPAGVDADNDGYPEEQDCDDNNPDVNPGVSESCDELDNDCDGQVDEGVQLSWYPDLDQDGFGGQEESGCEAPAQSVDQGGDCDDGDAETNPDASDVCDDGVDSDCDGADSRCTILLADADVRWEGLSEDDNLGGGIANIGDINQDGDVDFAIGASGVDHAGSYQGSVYLDLGPPASALVDALDVEVSVSGTGTGKALGSSVAAETDLNGDGIPDLIVSAPFVHTSHGGRGAVYIFLGPIDGDLEEYDAEGAWLGEDDGYCGLGLHAVGDATGDGRDDVLVGMPQGSFSGNEEPGVVLLMSRMPGGWAAAADEAVATLTGQAAGEELGKKLAHGDANGDGVVDILVGSDRESSVGKYAGSAYYLEGPFLGDLLVSDADTIVQGTAEQDRVGDSVAMDGDLDGDGYDDLLVSSSWNETGSTQGGAVFIFLGPPDVGGLTQTDADVVVASDEEKTYFGTAAAWAGSTDGGGADQILVGSPTFGENHQGAAYLVWPPVSGTILLSDSHYLRLLGEVEDGWLAGERVAAAGDVDGDGLDDIFVTDRKGAGQVGVAYLFLGASLQ